MSESMSFTDYDTHVVPVARRLDGTTDEARWIPLDEVAGLSRVSLVDIAIRLWRESRARV